MNDRGPYRTAAKPGPQDKPPPVTKLNPWQWLAYVLGAFMARGIPLERFRELIEQDIAAQRAELAKKT